MEKKSRCRTMCMIGKLLCKKKKKREIQLFTLAVAKRNWEDTQTKNSGSLCREEGTE